eukprot:gb/GFBE01030282.1/.p1 GENE.gb/GFBE01030282.1/~~gb/GFBE01030282.1/.p1  ORF type:complete len:203 (+),score=36.35 gb/GFBE01030282.1/:1-609(+)
MACLARISVPTMKYMCGAQSANVAIAVHAALQAAKGNRNDRPMNVTVCYQDGAAEEFAVKGSSTVNDLKRLIKESVHACIYDMHLYYLGRQLVDGTEKLSDCRMTDGSEIQLVVVSRARDTATARSKCRKARIFLKRPCGKTLPFDADLSASAQQVAREAAVHCGRRGAPCTLSFRGNALGRSCTLRDSGVEIGSVLHVSFD